MGLRASMASDGGKPFRFRTPLTSSDSKNVAASLVSVALRVFPLDAGLEPWWEHVTETLPEREHFDIFLGELL